MFCQDNAYKKPTAFKRGSMSHWKDKKCCECGKVITRDNFGILQSDYLCCNNPICQIATFDKIERNNNERIWQKLKLK